jgi:signal transduction histidine kinase
MDVESVIVQSIKTPIYDGSGNINGVQISFWDITARQRAEKALRELNATLEQRVAEANLHLAELSHLKDEFITRISHELRTPLANVKLYLQLLEQGQAEKREAYFLRSTNRSIACTTSSKICWMSLI